MKLISPKTLIILSSILNYGLFAAPPTEQVKVLEKLPEQKRTIEWGDLSHENKGCPENSQCDTTMGNLRKQWLAKVRSLLAVGEKPALLTKELQAWVAGHGWPVEFYTKKAAQQGFSPIIFDSSCAHHNPKDQPELKILRGLAFIKGLKGNKVVVHKEQTEYQIDHGDLIQLRPVIVYDDNKPTTYYLPLEDSPLYRENGSLVILREDEELFTELLIDQDGQWQMRAANVSDLSRWSEEKTDVACPEDKTLIDVSKYFQQSYCQTMWDKTEKKKLTVRYYWPCH